MNHEQIYGRNDMVMLNPNNKVYGSLGMSEQYVLDTVEGNPVTLENGRGGKIDKEVTDFRIYGKSTQKTTTGAQLLDISKWTAYDPVYGLTMSIQDDIVRLKGMFQKGKVGERSGAMFRFIYTRPGTVFPENVKFTAEIVNNTGTDGIYFTLTGLKENTPCIVISFYATYGDEVDIQLRPMLYVGDPVPKYEMYTGGKPSPSPDYPQEIESAGQVGMIGVNVRGKNLLNPLRFFSGRINNGVTWDVKNNGEIVCEGTASENSFLGSSITYPDARWLKIPAGNYVLSGSGEHVVVYINVVSLSGDRIGSYYSEHTRSVQCVFTEDVYISMQAMVRNGETAAETVCPQFESGDAATPYEPYHESQSMDIATPNGLPGIQVASGGNYTDADRQQWVCDEVDLARGVYVQRIAFTTVDGNAIKFKARGEFWNLPDGSAPGCYDINTVINNFFSKNMFGANGRYGFVYTLSTNMKKYFKTPDELNEFCKSKHDAGTPLTLCYALATTPIENPLTDEQIAAYKSLITHKGTTIIENDSDAHMKVTYKASAKK